MKPAYFAILWDSLLLSPRLLTAVLRVLLGRLLHDLLKFLGNHSLYLLVQAAGVLRQLRLGSDLGAILQLADNRIGIGLFFHLS